MLLFLPALITCVRGVGYDGLQDRNTCDFGRARATRDGLCVPRHRARMPSGCAGLARREGARGAPDDWNDTVTADLAEATEVPGSEEHGTAAGCRVGMPPTTTRVAAARQLSGGIAGISAQCHPGLPRAWSCHRPPVSSERTLHRRD